MEGVGKTKTTAISDPVLTPSPASIDPTSLKSLAVAFLFVVAISRFPYEENADGNRVPAVLFKGQLYSFQSFVILTMFAFSSSVSALYSYNRPGLARILRSCSVFFLSCAAAVLLFAACNPCTKYQQLLGEDTEIGKLDLP